jgi:hypothetical protein
MAVARHRRWNHPRAVPPLAQPSAVVASAKQEGRGLAIILLAILSASDYLVRSNNSASPLPSTATVRAQSSAGRLLLRSPSGSAYRSPVWVLALSHFFSAWAFAWPGRARDDLKG